MIKPPEMMIDLFLTSYPTFRSGGISAPAAFKAAPAGEWQLAQKSLAVTGIT